jgi:hypothetical protein
MRLFVLRIELANVVPMIARMMPTRANIVGPFFLQRESSALEPLTAESTKPVEEVGTYTGITEVKRTASTYPKCAPSVQGKVPVSRSLPMELRVLSVFGPQCPKLNLGVC